MNSRIIYLLEKIARNENDEETDFAPVEIFLLGSYAIPCLIAAMSHRNIYVRKAAASNLKTWGPAAEWVIPELAKAVRDGRSGCRTEAGDALAAIGPSAIPVLLELLGHGSDSTPRLAYLALAKIGIPALPALIETLESEDERIRCHAVMAITNMGPSARESIPALIGSLSDPEEKVRESAHEALRKMWPYSSEAIPALIQLIRNPVMKMDRHFAIVTIKSIGSEAREAIPALEELWSGAESSRRSWLEQVLRSVGWTG